MGHKSWWNNVISDRLACLLTDFSTKLLASSTLLAILLFPLVERLGKEIVNMYNSTFIYSLKQILSFCIRPFYLHFTICKSFKDNERRILLNQSELLTWLNERIISSYIMLFYSYLWPPHFCFCFFSSFIRCPARVYRK